MLHLFTEQSSLLPTKKAVSLVLSHMLETKVLHDTRLEVLDHRTARVGWHLKRS